MSQRTALVCLRRSDLRVPPVKSRLGRCRLCLQAVWISASSPKADKIFCKQCAIATVEPGDEVGPLTERQIADIRRAIFQ